MAKNILIYIYIYILIDRNIGIFSLAGKTISSIKRVQNILRQVVLTPCKSLVGMHKQCNVEQIQITYRTQFTSPARRQRFAINVKYFSLSKRCLLCIVLLGFCFEIQYCLKRVSLSTARFQTCQYLINCLKLTAACMLQHPSPRKMYLYTHLCNEGSVKFSDSVIFAK